MHRSLRVEVGEEFLEVDLEGRTKKELFSLEPCNGAVRFHRCGGAARLHPKDEDKTLTTIGPKRVVLVLVEGLGQDGLERGLFAKLAGLSVGGRLALFDLSTRKGPPLVAPVPDAEDATVSAFDVREGRLLHVSTSALLLGD